jgi:hypothetical protein
MNPAIDALVDRQMSELNLLTETGEITQLDRDRIGIIMGSVLGLLLEMSDKSWETVQRFVAESRIVWEVIETEREDENEKLSR